MSLSYFVPSGVKVRISSDRQWPDASVLFAYLKRDRYDREQAERVRQSLLEYFGVVTMAMAQLARSPRDLIRS